MVELDMGRIKHKHPKIKIKNPSANKLRHRDDYRKYWYKWGK